MAQLNKTQRTITYSAIPADHNGGFHPTVTVIQSGQENTLISGEIINGWLPAIERAKKLAKRVENHEKT